MIESSARWLTAVESQRLVAKGELDPQEVVRAHLDAIDRYDGQIVADEDPTGRELYWFTVVPIDEPREGTDLWAFGPCCLPYARVSTDGGRTWRDADDGLAGRIAGLFAVSGTVYAIGDGAYFWTGTEWRSASIVTGKGAAVFQLGTWFVLQDVTGGLWRSPRP